MRIDGDQCALRLLDLIAIHLDIRQLLHSGFRCTLCVHIDGRIDLEPLFIDSICAILIDEQLRHIIDKVGSFRIAFLLDRLHDLQFLGLGLSRQAAVDIAVFCHLVKDCSLAFLCGIEIVERRVIVRALRDTSKHGTFIERQILDVLAEVSLRCCLYAISTLPKIDLVHIHLEDFLLCILPLELQGQENLLYLTRQRAFLGQVRVLGQLLRDGRATLRDATAADVGIERTQDAARVDTAVLVEAVILDGHESILQVFGNLLDLDGPAVFSRVDIGNLIAIDIVNLRRRRRQDIVCQIGLRIHAGSQKTTANASDHDQDDQAKAEDDFFDVAAATFCGTFLTARIRI